MVKTKAPLLSLGASGKVGGVLIASNWRGRTYMKKLSIPMNPNTEPQVSVRAMMRFLTQLWAQVDPADQATWDVPATASNITPLDAFVAENLSRWGRFTPPGDYYPVDDTGSVPSLALTSVVAKGRGVLITINTFSGSYPTNLALHHGLVGAFPPAYTNAIWFKRASSASTHTFFHTPLRTGQHVYSVNANSQGGNAGGYPSQKSAFVT